MNSEVLVQLKRFVHRSIEGPNRQGQSIAMTQYTVKVKSYIVLCIWMYMILTIEYTKIKH